MDQNKSEPWIAQLKSHHVLVRIAAMKQMQESLQPSMLPALCDALSDRNKEVCTLATEALVQLGEIALPALCNALQDRRSWVRVRMSCQWALKALGEGRVVATLVLTDTQMTLTEKGEALNRLHRFHSFPRSLFGLYFPDAKTLCQEMLQTNDEAVRRGAAELLRWMEPVAAQLLRPSQPEATLARQELLRAAPPTENPDPAALLLRASNQSND